MRAEPPIPNCSCDQRGRNVSCERCRPKCTCPSLFCPVHVTPPGAKEPHPCHCIVCHPEEHTEDPLALAIVRAVGRTR